MFIWINGVLNGGPKILHETSIAICILMPILRFCNAQLFWTSSSVLFSQANNLKKIGSIAAAQTGRSGFEQFSCPESRPVFLQWRLSKLNDSNVQSGPNTIANIPLIEHCNGFLTCLQWCPQWRTLHILLSVLSTTLVY